MQQLAIRWRCAYSAHFVSRVEMTIFSRFWSSIGHNTRLFLLSYTYSNMFALNEKKQIVEPTTEEKYGIE